MLQVPDDSVRTALRRVFEDPAYRWVKPRDPFAQVGRWVEAFLRWYNRMSDAHPLVGYAFVAALVVVLVVILVHGASILVRTLNQAARADRSDAPVRVVERHDAAWHRRRSERLLQDGKYAEALMEEFWALIADLETRELVKFQSAKTPGEYLLEPRLRPDDRHDLSDLIERLYLLVFAGRGCTRDDVLAWRAAAHKIGTPRAV